MNPGQLETLIQLERATTTTGDYNAKTSTWNPIGNEWADVSYGTGSERRQAAQEKGQAPATFRVRDNEITRTVKTSDRLVTLDDEQVWDISSNVPANEPGFRDIAAVRSA